MSSAPLTFDQEMAAQIQSVADRRGRCPRRLYGGAGHQHCQRRPGQATTLSYIDTFMVLAVMAGIMFILSFLLKKNDPGGDGDAAVG